MSHTGRWCDETRLVDKLRACGDARTLVGAPSSEIGDWGIMCRKFGWSVAEGYLYPRHKVDVAAQSLSGEREGLVGFTQDKLPHKRKSGIGVDAHRFIRPRTLIYGQTSWVYFMWT
jgi:hypothetical protein